MAQQGHSAACCTVPPVVAKGYEPKGSYIDLDGMKVYTTGPSSATSAVFIIYDIFGLSSQAIQGADILAHSDKSHQYQVFMPDLFLGKPLPHSVYPPDTDEKKKTLGDFFGGPAAPPKTAEKVPQLSGTVFSAAAEVHPAMVDPNDAKDITIPLCMLASGDENPKDVDAFEKALTVPKHVETFGDQVHGWMAAR
ncbi:MAG: hypothetical protein LQ351_001999 [Letrouitia transgressa]|nr:MAG: hypothetical protein LQ351_001999 [Letrouitia transgressa]